LNLKNLIEELWPICRSITGNGLRKSLSIISELVPLEIKEYSTGKVCYDWKIPQEWNVRDAWVKSPDGTKLIDFKKNNLHLVNYSMPIKRKVGKEELLSHLNTLETQPDAIPYKTSYYNRDWGFCMPHSWFTKFTDDEYEVYIDSTLKDGSLSIGEGFVKGKSKKEFVFTTYLCHPSMANNELSGPAVQTALYNRVLKKKNLKYSYRFVYAPETIGDLVFLSQNDSHLKNSMIGGSVLTMLGNNNRLILEESSDPKGLFDRATRNVLKFRWHKQADIKPKTPHGRAAQRQYCSPGLKLPLSAISRGFGGSFPEYHTSLDNQDSLSEEMLSESLQILEQIIDTIEINDRFINSCPFGEPFMSRYNLGTKFGGDRINTNDLLMKCLLHSGDGEQDVLSIAERMGRSALDFAEPIKTLLQTGLLKTKGKY
jgi:aminopeptidase-like protein